MKRIILPFVIALLAIAVILGVSYQSIVQQTSVGDAESSSSTVEPEIPLTPNVSYEGMVEIDVNGAYRLRLSGGSTVILEPSDVNIDLSAYEGQTVEVRGSARPSSEQGTMLLRVEEVTVMNEDPPPEEQFFCGGIAGLPCPAGMICTDDPSDDCDPAAGGADCAGVCVPDSGEQSSASESSGSSTTSSAPAEASPSSLPSRTTKPSSSASSSASVAEPPSPESSSSVAGISDEQLALLEKQSIDEGQWTQQYCTSHIAFCIPIHRNWYYKSFGATTSNLWHVEIGMSAVEELGDGIIIVNLVDGTSASMNATDGQILSRDTDVIGFRDWNDGRHFEIIAPASAQDTVAYLISHIEPYTPAP